MNMKQLTNFRLAKLSIKFEINKTQIIENMIVDSRPFHFFDVHVRLTMVVNFPLPLHAIEWELCIVPLDTFIYGNLSSCDWPLAMICWHVPLFQASNLYSCLCVRPMMANQLLLYLSHCCFFLFCFAFDEYKIPNWRINWLALIFTSKVEVMHSMLWICPIGSH